MSNAEKVIGLLESIVDGAVINLEDYKYSLANIKAKYMRGVYFQDTFDGAELVVESLRDCKLLGSSSSSIVTESGYSAVLTLLNSSGIELSGLTFGHEPEKSFCAGDVLRFVDCKNVTLTNLDLFGCGIYGLNMEKCDDFEIVDCVIRECTDGIASLSHCERISFKNCTFKENLSKLFHINHCDQISFVGCRFEKNSLAYFADEDVTLFLHGSCGEVTCVDCYFDEKGAISNRIEDVTLIENIRLRTRQPISRLVERRKAGMTVGALLGGVIEAKVGMTSLSKVSRIAGKRRKGRRNGSSVDTGKLPF